MCSVGADFPHPAVHKIPYDSKSLVRSKSSFWCSNSGKTRRNLLVQRYQTPDILSRIKRTAIVDDILHDLAHAGFCRNILVGKKIASVPLALGFRKHSP